MYQGFIKRCKGYLEIARLTKPWGILLLGWPTLCGLALSSERLDFTVWFVFVLGIILTRSLGCVINDYADQWLDGHVQRTKHRPLVAGTLSPNQAKGYMLVLALASLSLLGFLPKNVLVWALISAIVLIIYPYTKRFLKAPQLFLGLVFSMGIPMAYAANQQPFDIQMLLFFLGNMLSVIIYDTIYAITDLKDDLKQGANSFAIYLHPHHHLFVGVGYTLLAIYWCFFGRYSHYSITYYLCLIPLFKNYYHQYQWVCQHQPFKAFLANTKAGGWLFLGIMINTIYL